MPATAPFYPPPDRAIATPARRPLPEAVASLVWRGNALGTPTTSVVSTGFDALDRELPGGGWPCHALTELLQAQPATLEWRLLAPAIRPLVAAGQSVVVVAPPRQPHLPGLHHAGIDERHLVWVQADTPAERLWCTEQVIRANAFGALIAWLPQARPEQIRRLQVSAQDCDAPVFLFRPQQAQREASAAPLRVIADLGPDWSLQVHILKRRGPVHDGAIRLDAIPGGLSSVLTPRLMQPSQLVSLPSSVSNREVTSHALGSTVASHRPRRQPTLQ
jgi:protein ImuA